MRSSTRDVLADLLEHAEAVAEAFGHGPKPCDPDGKGWQTDFCRYNGCLQFRILAARNALGR